MAIISKISLLEQPEQHVLSIRTTIHFNDYPNTAKQAYKKIVEYAALHGLLFSGGPFVCYHNTDLENLDVEMGFPVAKLVSGEGDIVGYTIPVQKAVSGIFLGAYTDTDPLMMGIIQWIAEHGYEQQGRIFNYYLNDDDRPASELLTQIIVPIK
ncbi:transcriptional regulator [Desulfosporosinus fructosivorans]|uniref:Transcriptional regulator n=1 Tax=Desulfosporosinus fructosivorans TaxID=2018669 RepID=A0A4Z0QWQ9_9FIRM|nr:GyrI-like domain-containing protein [Desulfosporosinus fructosivorans]TGE34739.1 transcriptional regulator [Desulfosporosinus fructosivorans]